MAEYSEAFERAVTNWLDVNRTMIAAVMTTAVEKALDPAIVGVADGMSKKLGKFLDDNRDALVTAIAASIAASWHTRHP